METLSWAKSSPTALMSAAVKAKPMALAVPKSAARHQRGPRNANATATAIAPPHIVAAIAQAHGVGGAPPGRGLAKIRKPASPAPAASAPKNSREPTLKRT